MKKVELTWLFPLLLVLLTGCGSSGNKETPAPQCKDLGRNKVYKGTLNILADKGLESIIRQQVDIFAFEYDSVQVVINYANEAAILDSFRAGSAQVGILTRQLDQKEKDFYRSKDTLYIREVQVASDAVAMVVNKKFAAADLTLDMLKSYFSLTGKSPYKLVFDNQESSTVSAVLKALGLRDKVSSSVYALNTPQEVINYTETHDDCIGFIPYSLVSDTDDEQARQIFKKVKILSLRAQNAEGKTVSVSANQSDIADGVYPLIRPVNAITRFSYSDNLEWLFINFMYRERGAKIFLKAGYIPTKMPEREINVNTGPLKGGD